MTESGMVIETYNPSSGKEGTGWVPGDSSQQAYLSSWALGQTEDLVSKPSWVAPHEGDLRLTFVFIQTCMHDRMHTDMYAHTQNQKEFYGIADSLIGCLTDQCSVLEAKNIAVGTLTGGTGRGFCNFKKYHLEMAFADAQQKPLVRTGRFFTFPPCPLAYPLSQTQPGTRKYGRSCREVTWGNESGDQTEKV